MSEEDIYMIEKSKFRGIIAHRDLDGAIAAGLISRIFPEHISFRKEVSNAESQIIIETQIIDDTEIRDCLIIDHHMCHDLAGLIGNFVICDEDFPSAAELVSTFFDLEIDSRVLEIINNIEKGEIFSDEATKKVFLAYISNYIDFPFQRISELVKKGQWKRLLELFDNLFDKEKIESIRKLSEEKINSAIDVGNKTKLLTYDFDQDIDLAATRLASIILQDKGYIVITAAKKDNFVLFGLIANKSGYSLKSIFKKLKSIGWRAGGRRDVGGFKVNRPVSIDEFFSIIKGLFK